MGEIADYYADLYYTELAERDHYIMATVRLCDSAIVILIEEVLSDFNYEENQYTDLVLSVYMAYHMGYVLTERQKRCVAIHIWEQGTDNWY